MDDVQNLYTEYDWIDFLDPASLPRLKWDDKEKRHARNRQRPEPDWRVANGTLYMGTDTMALINNARVYGEYLIRADVSSVPARMTLWHGYAKAALGGGLRIDERGIKIKISADQISIEYFTGRPEQAFWDKIAEGAKVRREEFSQQIGKPDLYFNKPKKNGNVCFRLITDWRGPLGEDGYPFYAYLDGERLCDVFYARFLCARSTIYEGVYKEIKFRGPLHESH